MKQKWIPLLFCLPLLLLTGCVGSGAAAVEEISYTQITAEEAKTMMDGQQNYILLDVRTKEEYEEGHIAGAVLIPDSEITDRAEKELADKDSVILVYCRSGRRSKQAAQQLAGLGYPNVYEFGGMIDWPYAVVK